MATRQEQTPRTVPSPVDVAPTLRRAGWAIVVALAFLLAVMLAALASTASTTRAPTVDDLPAPAERPVGGAEADPCWDGWCAM